MKIGVLVKQVPDTETKIRVLDDGSGIEAGDIIRVVTRRGAIELRARGDAAVPDVMIFVPFCYAEAAANVLTNPALDAWGKIPEFKYCAARVERTS